MTRWWQEAGRMASWFLKLVLLAFAVVFASNGEWVLAASALLALAIALSPALVERDWKLTTPWVLDLLITLMLFLHMGGLFTNVYDQVPYYDRVLHAASSAIVAFIGLLLGYTADRYWRGFSLANVQVLAFLIFMLTVAVGALWELGEFAGDQLLGTTNQDDNYDTMVDIFWDAVAGLMVAVGGAVAIKRGWVDGMAAEMGDGVRRLQDGRGNRPRGRGISRGGDED